MKKVLIFGTGSTGMRIYQLVKEEAEIIGFLDNDKKKWGSFIEDTPVLGNADALKSSVEFDEILVCSLPAMQLIKKQLLDAGVDPGKINCSYIETQVNARINFLQDYAKLYAKDVESLSVAEGGVYQGEFAKEINRCFPHSTLYLFDTFEGFDQHDIKAENVHGGTNVYVKEGHLSNTSVDIVMGKMPFPRNVVIRKGMFPDTVKGLPEVAYGFVNLDFDLYQPILAGLRYFFPRMLQGSVLLVHEYYNSGYPGVKKAVVDYESELGKRLMLVPIGDHCSIAILKC